jgi:uncharacterized protein YsxB (DUF464 family)
MMAAAAAAAAVSFSAKGQSGSAEIAEHDIICAGIRMVHVEILLCITAAAVAAATDCQMQYVHCSRRVTHVESADLQMHSTVLAPANQESGFGISGKAL